MLFYQGCGDGASFFRSDQKTAPILWRIEEISEGCEAGEGNPSTGLSSIRLPSGRHIEAKELTPIAHEQFSVRISGETPRIATDLQSAPLGVLAWIRVEQEKRVKAESRESLRPRQHQPIRRPLSTVMFLRFLRSLL